MQVVIPMSGVGARFRKAGYRALKPLIEVDGMPIIEHVVRMFPGESNFIFVCNREALKETPLRRVLERLAPEGRIVEIDPHKRGPVHAVLQASSFISPDDSVVVNYCDFSVQWDYLDFKKTVEKLACEGCITAYRGFHPHSLGPNLYAYLRHNNNYLVEIAEKHCFTEDRMQEYASTGTYYFRSGKLLLHYFEQAVRRGLQLNGEFYASIPYNLLVEDSLRVYIYEINKFLQWGTPEDLEEYQLWSKYFRCYENWRPSSSIFPGVNLIPMAGAGARFAHEGFVDPKPLIKVDGIPLVQRSIESLPGSKKWISVCQSSHLRDPRLMSILGGSTGKFQTLQVDALTSGQLATCLRARDQLDPDAPLLIAPCDAMSVYDEGLLAEMMNASHTDCLVWVFRNHPHANRNPRQYGWVVASENGEIHTVLCKQPPAGNIREANGIIGTFWFRKAQYFLGAAEAIMAEDRRINGEFYVDSCIGVLIEQKRRARIFPVQHYVCFGTPDDVHTYQYWADYFHSKAGKARAARA